MWFSFDLYTVQLQNADLKVNQFSDSLINLFFIAKAFYLMQVCINRKPATKVLYWSPNLTCKLVSLPVSSRSIPSATDRIAHCHIGANKT